MKFKGIMLITLVLLVVLTIGAISASEDISQDDNLTVIETGGFKIQILPNLLKVMRF